MTPRPVAIAAVISPAKNMILLIRRKFKPYYNYWALPGGTWKRGESLEEAVKREILEETRHELDRVRLVAIVSEKLVDTNGYLIDHFLLFFCMCQATEVLEPSLTLEGQFCWFNTEKMPTDLVPTDKKLIEQYVMKGYWENSIQFHNVILQELSANQYKLTLFK